MSLMMAILSPSCIYHEVQNGGGAVGHQVHETVHARTGEENTINRITMLSDDPTMAKHVG